MPRETLYQKVDDYKEIYSLLKDKLKWKAVDKKALMMVASIYIVNGKSFNLNHFLELSDYIMNQVGFFSPLRSYQRFMAAAMLDVRFQEPKEKFHDFINLYNQLVADGFSKGAFTYISALVMMSNESVESDHQENIERSLAIYKGMKAKHYFLTSKSDYPLAVLLAQVDGDIEELMNRIEFFYQKLNENGFRKGNDLQFLSHILSLDHENKANNLINCFTNLFDLFKQSGQKPKALHYSMIGLLALLDEGTKEVEVVQQIAKQLNSEKLFKWDKDMNFMMAVNFVMSERIDNSLLSTGIHTTIETIIQAQQAAMVASMAGVSAATAASSGQ